VVDSETRWRLVRRQKQRPQARAEEIIIRAAEAGDLPQIKDICNFFIQNTVITFDDKPLDLAYWQEKFDHISKLNFPFLVVARESEVLGYALVTPWRQRRSSQNC
jgi:phosphinothricin acetyltransferase